LAKADENKNLRGGLQMTNALYKEGSHSIPVKVSIEFIFDKTPLKILFGLNQTPALPDVPCSQCKKTSRQIFAAHEVQLPEDVSGDKIMEMALDLISNEQSILDSSAVYVLTEASVLEMEDSKTGVDMINASIITTAIEIHANKVLVNLPICDGCLYPSTHIEELLKEK
jgi:hypothetical protein